MAGWSILFAILSLSGVAVDLGNHTSSLWVRTATFIFGVLFLMSLLTRAGRGPSRG
jgi:hypothetical protein